MCDTSASDTAVTIGSGLCALGRWLSDSLCDAIACSAWLLHDFGLGLTLGLALGLGLVLLFGNQGLECSILKILQLLLGLGVTF